MSLRASPAMSASSSTAPLVFGLVVLDLQKRELIRKGRARPLRPTSFDLLAYLAANAGRIISTDELTGAVWPGQSVSAETLAQAMGEVRQALTAKRLSSASSLGKATASKPK